MTSYNLLPKPTKTTLQPDDDKVSTNPASTCEANADDEEKCHRLRKKSWSREAPAIEG